MDRGSWFPWANVTQGKQQMTDPLEEDLDNPITGVNVNMNVGAQSSPQQLLVPTNAENAINDEVNVNSANTSGGISSILPNNPMQSLVNIGTSMYQALVDNGTINELNSQTAGHNSGAAGGETEVEQHGAGGRNAASGAIPRTRESSMSARAQNDGIGQLAHGVTQQNKGHVPLSGPPTASEARCLIKYFKEVERRVDPPSEDEFEFMLQRMRQDPNWPPEREVQFHGRQRRTDLGLSILNNPASVVNNELVTMPIIEMNQYQMDSQRESPVNNSQIRTPSNSPRLDDGQEMSPELMELISMVKQFNVHPESLKQVLLAQVEHLQQAQEMTVPKHSVQKEELQRYNEQAPNRRVHVEPFQVGPMGTISQQNFISQPVNLQAQMEQMARQKEVQRQSYGQINTRSVAQGLGQQVPMPGPDAQMSQVQSRSGTQDTMWGYCDLPSPRSRPQCSVIGTIPWQKAPEQQKYEGTSAWWQAGWGGNAFPMGEQRPQMVQFGHPMQQQTQGRKQPEGQAPSEQLQRNLNYNWRQPVEVVTHQSIYQSLYGQANEQGPRLNQSGQAIPQQQRSAGGQGHQPAQQTNMPSWWHNQQGQYPNEQQASGSNPPPWNAGSQNVNLQIQRQNEYYGRQQQQNEYQKNAMLQKISKLDLPKFRGRNDYQSPYEYLRQIKIAAATQSIELIQILAHKLPMLLIEEAGNWFAVNWSSMGTWDDFEKAFVQEYSSPNYRQDLIKDLEQRTQSPEEAGTVFLHKIVLLCKQIDPSVPELVITEKVKEKMHPSYRHYTDNYSYATVNQMEQHLLSIQRTLYSIQTYKPPPAASHFSETAFAYKEYRSQPKVEFAKQSDQFQKPHEQKKIFSEVSLSSLNPSITRERARKSQYKSNAYESDKDKYSRDKKFYRGRDSPYRGNSPARSDSQNRQEDWKNRSQQNSHSRQDDGKSRSQYNSQNRQDGQRDKSQQNSYRSSSRDSQQDRNSNRSRESSRERSRDGSRESRGSAKSDKNQYERKQNYHSNKVESDKKYNKKNSDRQSKNE